jgi:CheY-like chemotaxis protein
LSSKILVVEDHAETRNLLGKLLEIEGYNTICAGDGQEGFETARQENPDLIVTDIGMPKVDGIELIRMIREDATCRDIPVIVVTAYGESACSKAIETGANAVIDKPLQFDSLLELIRELLITLVCFADACIVSNLFL